MSLGIPWQTSGWDSALFYCWGAGFNPWLGNWDPTSCVVRPEKRKIQTICVISLLSPLLDECCMQAGPCLSYAVTEWGQYMYLLCDWTCTLPSQRRAFELSTHSYLSCLALLAAFSPLGARLSQKTCATVQTEIQHPLRPSPGIKISAFSPGTRHCDWLPFWHNKGERKKDNRIWMCLFFFI